ncbi:FRG domain-containing protein [Pantoea anthophila]|uniref:FRG domain-containing protein n=1 Tax=Pantoea anthophila TaxID=470931 RepID=UPI00301E26C6
MSEITSVHDYLSVVNEFAPKDESFYKRAYYRGQRQFKYNVNSSLSRVFSANELKPNNVAAWNLVTGGTDLYDVSSMGFATELFETFKNEHINYPDVNILKKYTLNDLGLMFNAQHYGMATRVIDWTLSPLVALYFATEDKNDELISDASVFMLWNSKKNLDICTSNDLVDRISSYKAIYSKVWELIHSFINEHYFYYKTTDSIEAVREPLLELKHNILQLHRNIAPGRHILLNEKHNYIDLVFPLKGDDEFFLKNCLDFFQKGFMVIIIA